MSRPRYHGWWVVFCCFVVALYGWGFGFYGLSLYLVALTKAHGWSPATISAAITFYYIAGAFLVMESREHAEARGAKPYARLTKVVADLAQRKQPGAVTKSLEALWPKLGIAGDSGNLITGATGVEPVTSEEKAFLAKKQFIESLKETHE